MHFLVTVAVLVQAPSSGGASARLGEARAAIVAAERARGAEVIEDPEALVAAGWTAERNLAFFARGSELVSDGRRALARVELQNAEALLAAAEKVYEPERARPGVDAEWADAAKWHGVALYELKRRDEATEAWRRAKALYPDTMLTEAMVRPEVAQAFAAVAAGDVTLPPAAPRDADWARVLGVDEIVDAAIAIDAGVLTYAATRRADGCATEAITATRADELVRRLEAAPCRSGAAPSVLALPAIAHPRPVPSLAKTMPGGERRVSAWRRPWLWVGVVGALGVGVVLAASLWPREPSYSATANFGSFAGPR